MSETVERKGEGYTVRIQEGPILPFQEVATDSGGRVTFAGIVRPSEEGRDITSLNYDAYSEMAIRNLEEIVKGALELYSPLYIYAVHRIGAVQAGETSVLIDVFSEHRTEGFKACSLVIDRIKKEVPIWKKVIYADGSHQWKDEIEGDLKEVP